MNHKLSQAPTTPYYVPAWELAGEIIPLDCNVMISRRHRCIFYKANRSLDFRKEFMLYAIL